MAVKNLVITEHAFKIDHFQAQIKMMKCSRCGHLQPRKARTACVACNRLITETPARQSWDEDPCSAKRKNPYAERFNDDNGLMVSPDMQFKVTRKKEWAIIRMLREFGIFALVFATVWFSTPLLGKALLGEAGMAKLDHSLQTTIRVITAPSPTGTAKLKLHK